MTLHHTGLTRLSRATRAGLLRRLRTIDRCALGDAVTVSVAFIDDEAIRDLNHAFRGISRPTDVLSFPVGDDPFAPPGSLGDIAISIDTAGHQAARFGHDLSTELTVLFVHGLTHLLGYDHTRGTAHARAQAECELSLISLVDGPLDAPLVGRALGLDRPGG